MSLSGPVSRTTGPNWSASVVRRVQGSIYMFVFQDLIFHYNWVLASEVFPEWTLNRTQITQDHLASEV
jgi:hypothetical protein